MFSWSIGVLFGSPVKEDLSPLDRIYNFEKIICDVWEVQIDIDVDALLRMSNWTRDIPDCAPAQIFKTYLFTYF